MLLDLVGQDVRHAARQPASIGPVECGTFAALPAQDGAMGIGRPGFRAGEERRAELRRLRAERQCCLDAPAVDDAAGRDHGSRTRSATMGVRAEGLVSRFLRRRREIVTIGAATSLAEARALGRDRGGRNSEDEAEHRRPCLEQGLDLFVEARVIACRRLGPAEAQLAKPGLEHRPGALGLGPARLPATGIVVGDPKVQGKRSGGAAADLGREWPDLVRLQDMGAIGAEAAQVETVAVSSGVESPPPNVPWTIGWPIPRRRAASVRALIGRSPRVARRPVSRGECYL